jgi:hypothetical protein
MATTLRVSWPANPADEQVTKYELFQSKDGGPFTSLGLIVGTSKDILNPLTGVYRFKIKAWNLAGSSPESAVASSPAIPSTPSTPEVVVIES